MNKQVFYLIKSGIVRFSISNTNTRKEENKEYNINTKKKEKINTKEENKTNVKNEKKTSKRISKKKQKKWEEFKKKYSWVDELLETFKYS